MIYVNTLINISGDPKYNQKHTHSKKSEFFGKKIPNWENISLNFSKFPIISHHLPLFSHTTFLPVKYFPTGENMGNPGKFWDNISWNGKNILMLKSFSSKWVLFSWLGKKLSHSGFLFSHLGNTFSHIEFYFHGWEKYCFNSGLYSIFLAARTFLTYWVLFSWMRKTVKGFSHGRS